MKRNYRGKMVSMISCVMLAAMFLNGCANTEVPETETVMEIKEAEQEPETQEPKEFLPLSVHTRPVNEIKYAEDGETALLYLKTADVTVSGDGYEKLANSVAGWCSERQKALNNNAVDSLEAAKAAKEQEEDFYGYAISQQVEVMRADESVLSLLDAGYENMGGAHPNVFRTGVTFDSVTGNQLEIEDVISDMDGFKEEATQYLIYTLKETYGDALFEGLEETLEQMWEWGPDWYLDASGIVMIFNEYAVGPYAMGVPEIHLPYETFSRYMYEKYLLTGNTAVLRLPVNEEVYLDIPSVDAGVAIILTRTENEYDYSYSLWIGENEMPIGEFPVLGSAYLIQKKDGRTFIILDVDVASDDYETHLYELTNGLILETDCEQASIDAGNVNADSVNLEFWLHVLGTYGASKEYYIDGEGNFATAEEMFELDYEAFTLTAVRELKAQVGEEETVIPAGSHLRVTATDNKTKVTVYVEEMETEATIYYTRGEGDESWKIFIDGQDENDCFEVLPYAG
ncbi:MAG: DUF3298 domain-containing protein [Lachnospiraceae bacterium]